MNRLAARLVITAVIIVAWPVLCIAAVLYVTGLVVNSIAGEWVK